MSKLLFWNRKEGPRRPADQQQVPSPPSPPRSAKPPPKFFQRTTSLPDKSSDLVPLWDPKSNEVRMVSRERICAVKERDGSVVLAIAGYTGVVVEAGGVRKRPSGDLEGDGPWDGPQAQKEMEELDEGFGGGKSDEGCGGEDPADADRLRRDAHSEWSENPHQRALTISSGTSFDEFVQTWCPAFPVLEEDGDVPLAEDEHSLPGSRPRVAFNPSRVLDVQPDLSAHPSGVVIVDFGERATWLRTKSGTKHIQLNNSQPSETLCAPFLYPTEQGRSPFSSSSSQPASGGADSRVQMRLRAESITSVMLKIDPSGWEDVELDT
ncbi:hypothetical protein HK104_000073 [Borealophlyctis nickersoniae]|nr:hypothetical protein HK104_000073 [Borealophlyctis nickersoniae]